jgi:1-aminocyclopropane-1-carboxylate deaminase/D-cysteine desulfhydrase-like pyridoxal-dependent ACC family enzyme
MEFSISTIMWIALFQTLTSCLIWCRFGKIYAGEIGACQHIAQSNGILLDPIYTLAGWEVAQELCCEEESKDGAKVALLHTGGTLGLFGLAQRFPHHFE